MKKYIVCMDSYRVRDAQMFNTTGFTDSQLLEIDPFSDEFEDCWHDMELTPFIAVVSAESENEACEIAGRENRYDPRCLFSIEIGG